MLLRMLGRQIGILLANVAPWRELLEARQQLEQENRYYREAAQFRIDKLGLRDELRCSRKADAARSVRDGEP